MRKILATVLLVLYGLSWLGIVDFYICIGRPGSCVDKPTARPRPQA